MTFTIANRIFPKERLSAAIKIQKKIEKVRFRPVRQVRKVRQVRQVRQVRWVWQGSLVRQARSMRLKIPFGLVTQFETSKTC